MELQTCAGFFLSAGYRVQKFKKNNFVIAEKQLSVILVETELTNLKNRCRFRRFSKPIKFLNRAGLEPLLCNTHCVYVKTLVIILT